FIVLCAIVQPFLGQVFCYFLPHVCRALARQPDEASSIDTKLVYRCDDSQVKFLREGKVLATATRGNMDDAGTFSCAHFFPGYDGVYYALLGREFVKWAAIAPAVHIAAIERLHNMVVALVTAFEGFQHGQ